MRRLRLSYASTRATTPEALREALRQAEASTGLRLLFDEWAIVDGRLVISTTSWRASRLRGALIKQGFSYHCT